MASDLRSQWDGQGLPPPMPIGAAPSATGGVSGLTPLPITAGIPPLPVATVGKPLGQLDPPQSQPLGGGAPVPIGSVGLGGPIGGDDKAGQLGPKLTMPSTSTNIGGLPSSRGVDKITLGSSESTYLHPWMSALRRSFQFQSREGKRFDWPRVSSVRLNQIIAARDFSLLEELLPHLAFANITDTWNFTSSDFLHIIRLMQLELEYLMAIRQHYVQELRQKDYEMLTIHGSTDKGSAPPGFNLRNSEFLSSGNIAQEVGVAVQAVLAADGVNRETLQRTLGTAISEMTALREELARSGSLVLAKELQLAKDEEERRESEWKRYREAWELEERTRRLKLEQELYNKERLLTLERERLEKARLALELEQQKLQNRNAPGAVDISAIQRSLNEQLQAFLAQLQQESHRLTTSVSSIQLPPPAPTPPLIAPIHQPVFQPQPEPPVQIATRGVPAIAPPQQPQQPPVPRGPVDRYKLKLSAQNLPKMDILSLTDPFVVVFTAPANTRASIDSHPPPGYKLLDMTPYIMDTLDPVWTEPIVIEWVENQDLAVHFQLWDLDTGKGKHISPSNYLRHKYIGCTSISLTQVTNYLGQLRQFDITDRNGKLCHNNRGQSKLNIICTSTLAEERQRAEREAQLRASEEARLLDQLRQLIAAKERDINMLTDQINKKVALQKTHADRMLAMQAYNIKVSGAKFPTMNSLVRIFATEMHQTPEGIVAQEQKFAAMTETSSGTHDPTFYNKLTLYCPSFEDQEVEFVAYSDNTNGAVNIENFDRLQQQCRYLGTATSRLSDLLRTQVTLPLKVEGRPTASTLVLKAEVDPTSTEMWKATAQQKIDEYQREIDTMRATLQSYQQELANLQETLARKTGTSPPPPMTSAASVAGSADNSSTRGIPPVPSINQQGSSGPPQPLAPLGGVNPPPQPLSSSSSTSLSSLPPPQPMPLGGQSSLQPGLPQALPPPVPPTFQSQQSTTSPMPQPLPLNAASTSPPPGPEVQPITGLPTHPIGPTPLP